MLDPRASIALICLTMGSSSAMGAQGPSSPEVDPFGGHTSRDALQHNWPQWRGPDATGVAPHADPPTEWSESKNVRWKTPLPGMGHSTPVVWENLIFVTAAAPVGERVPPRLDERPGAHDNRQVTQKHRYMAFALDRNDGTILWQRDLLDEFPHEGGHTTGTYASQSPITDGERIYVSFGSRGLFCLDLDGVVQWQLHLGNMRTKHGHGEGSTPVLFGDTLVVNWDHEGDSLIAAFDKRTGEELWRTMRDEVTSWASPIVVVHEDTPQVIVSGTQRLRAYDLSNGKVIWECGGLSHNVVASPVSSDGMVYAGSSYEKQAFIAVRLAGAQGDVSNTENLVWYRRKSTPYVPSPLLYGDTLYFLHHYQGFLTRVEAKTGKDSGRPMRLDGLDDVYASLLGAAGRVYIVDRSGVTLVLSHEARPKQLARNTLNDSFSASPVAIGQDLLLRGERFLYCLTESASDPALETKTDNR